MSIEKILNINHERQIQTGELSITSPILNEEGEPIWKVLVFDNLGRDVISSVLRVQDLRNFGVTIHLYAPPAIELLGVCLRIFKGQWLER